MEKQEYNADLADKAQREYCQRKEFPSFAPTKFCYSCDRDIYSEGGYSVKEAGERSITGCPFCHRSYCD